MKITTMQFTFRVDAALVGDTQIPQHILNMLEREVHVAVLRVAEKQPALAFEFKSASMAVADPEEK